MKINWKILLLAMIIPLIMTCYFSYGLQMILSERQELWDNMTENSIGGLGSEIKERYDTETQATLIGGIGTIVAGFCISTVICYVIINWIKKRGETKT